MKRLYIDIYIYAYQVLPYNTIMTDLGSYPFSSLFGRRSLFQWLLRLLELIMFLNNVHLINLLPHGHISSSRSGIRLLPQVEGQILRNLIFNFRCRLDDSQNELVKCILFRNIIKSSKRKSHWNRLFLPNGEENG